MTEKSEIRIQNLMKKLDYEIKEIEKEEKTNKDEEKEIILSKNFTKSFEKKNDDIVIVCPCRTPLTKAKKGGLKGKI
jgi:hypothetical protein